MLAKDAINTTPSDKADHCDASGTRGSANNAKIRPAPTKSCYPGKNTRCFGEGRATKKEEQELNAEESARRQLRGDLELGVRAELGRRVCEQSRTTNCDTAY